MKNHPLHKRLGFALAGVKEGWIRGRSLRIEAVFGVLAFLALCILRPAPIWWALVALVSGVVLATELLNSALEALIDHLHPELHPQIRIVKDMAAGGVLIVAIAAVLVAIALLVTVALAR